MAGVYEGYSSKEMLIWCESCPEMSIYWKKKKETFFRIYVHHDAIFIIEYHKIMTLILRDRNGVCVYETSDTNTK